MFKQFYIHSIHKAKILKEFYRVEIEVNFDELWNARKFLKWSELNNSLFETELAFLYLLMHELAQLNFDPLLQR